MTTVDTSNYFEVAVADERANATPGASGSTTPAISDDKASKKARRDQRIAEAVQRSKVEYTAENVYTERGVSNHCGFESRLTCSGFWKNRIEASRNRKSINKDLVSLANLGMRCVSSLISSRVLDRCALLLPRCRPS
jgi:hypothetical protein